jgi:glucan phosphoethanolaminetransferase (alkaline phosphatase superfamily)
MTFVLGALLPLFNDPFFAITIESPNRGTAVLGVLFTSDFVAYMSLYQLVLFSRMIYENGDKQSTALDYRKCGVCLLMWIFMMASYITIQLRFFSDPTNTYDDYTDETFMALKIIFYLISALIFAFILFYYVQFFRFYNSRLWRYKQFGIFSIYFVAGLQILIFTGSFSTYFFDGSRVLLVIGILNLYVFYMLYLWSPNKKALEQIPAQQKRLNDHLKSNEQYEVVDDNFVIEDEP